MVYNHATTYKDWTMPIKGIVGRQFEMISLHTGRSVKILFIRAWHLLLLAVILMGCSGNSTSALQHSSPLKITPPDEYATEGFDFQRTRWNLHEHTISPATISHLQLYWISNLKINAHPTAPIVANGFVYFGAGSHMYALNASSGTPRWISDPVEGIITSTPSEVSGIIYAGSISVSLPSAGSSVYAFNAATGRLLWKTQPIRYDIIASTTVANNIIYIGTALDPKLYAFNAKTGKPLWTSVPLEGFDHEEAVANGIVYADNHKLYAFDAITGKIRWSIQVIPPRKDIAELSPPVFMDSTVYIGSVAGLYAFDATTGKFLWIVPIKEGCAFYTALANGVAYIVSGEGKLYAIDAIKGKIRWISTNHYASNPMIANNVIYIHVNNSLHALDATTGKELWTSEKLATGAVFGPFDMAILDGVIYDSSCTTTDPVNTTCKGRIYAFHLPNK